VDREGAQHRILFLVSWAFSIAASGLFRRPRARVWWKRCGTVAGVVGAAVGFTLCIVLLITTEFTGPWLKGVMGDAVTLVPARGRQVAFLWGMNNIAVGIFAIPAAFLAQWLVAQFTPRASDDMQEFIDSIRVPVGDVRHVAGAELH
jgi:cation/acetate symporter